MHRPWPVRSAVPAGDMIGMYDTMHEADISKFVIALDERLKELMDS